MSAPNNHEPPPGEGWPLESLNRPSRARLTNLLLGGNESLKIDRILLANLEGIAPDVARLAINEAAFIERAWRYLSGVRGIRQVVHCGAPIPPGLPPHHVAWEADALRDQGPVVYAERDKLLAAKGRALLVDHSTIAVVETDPLEPTAMFETSVMPDLIDLAQPVAVIAPSLLHQVREGHATRWMAELKIRLAPGSCVVATHALDPETDTGSEYARRLESALMFTVGDTSFRTKDEIEWMFRGWSILKPGVIPCQGWWPSGPRLREETPCDRLMAGVVAELARASP